MHGVVVKPSPIEGLGLYAARSFSRGKRIREINVVRLVTPDEPLRPDLGERQDQRDYPDGKVVLLGFPDRHLNHSCDPNAFVSYVGKSSCLVARREIRHGEEITVDYNINITGGSEWRCRCGAERCTGLVVGTSSGCRVDSRKSIGLFWPIGSSFDIVTASVRS